MSFHPGEIHMFAKRFLICGVALTAMLATLAVITIGEAAGDKKPEKKKEVWTDRNDATLPADFRFQGEYVFRSGRGDSDLGCSVIALGQGNFQAVLMPGG